MSMLHRFLFPNMSEGERTEQLREIVRNLKQQIPLLYAVLLINLIGLHVATRGLDTPPGPFGMVLGLLLGWRFFYWFFLQKPIGQIANIESELARIALFTALISTVFAVWVQVLIVNYEDQIFAILLYSVLMTLGAAFGLSSFSLVAALPVILVGLPVAGRLFFMDEPAYKGIGVSLFLALLLVMRLLYFHGRALTDLVEGRFAVDRERNRAIAAETAALHRASRDGLTGLANRETLVEAVEVGLRRASNQKPGSLLALFDLDFFKPANDAYGHAAGDAILAEIGRRMEDEFGQNALIARMGGDEFAIFWPAGLGQAELAEVGSIICRLTADPVVWHDKSLKVTASCGLTEAGAMTTSVREFLRQADSALYKVKTSGRGGWRLYNEELFEYDRRRKEIEGLLLTGRVLEEVEVHFQPIIDLEHGEIVSAEALARWNNADLGAIAPSEFIRVAEQLGMIHELNDVLLRRALSEASKWPGTIGLSFNLSAAQLSRPDAATRLLAIVDESGFPPERLQLEVTETAILSDIEEARMQMHGLRAAGCQLALDDFGAGHTSIGYLRDLSFDVVKFDGSISAKITECPRARHVLRGLVHLCHSVGSRCVSEHIETIEQLAHVKAMSCDMVQGHLLGAATSTQGLVERLAGNAASLSPTGPTLQQIVNS